MAITQATPTSFKLELMEGVHNFLTDTFYIALYGTSASLGPGTTAYTSTGEVSSAGYTAGGQALTITPGYPTTYNQAAIVTFVSPSWTNVTFIATGALIYNSSKANRAVAVINFGSTFSVTSSNFTISMPAATDLAAIVRVV
jgi:hypothetical protein